MEGLGWARKFAVERVSAARVEKALATLGDQPYFLFPLQLTNDYQIREHSPFASMTEAVDYVLYSFARRATRRCATGCEGASSRCWMDELESLSG